jgi:hypothetical protein
MNGPKSCVSFDTTFSALSPNEESRRPLNQWTPPPGWQ